jgi:hypothetical protein
VAHDIYGDPDCPLHIHEIRLANGDTITEVPASSVTVLGRNIPVAGGGWLRQFPYWFTSWAVRKINAKKLPAVVYFHPWELDPDTPRYHLELKNYVRQYGNLSSMRPKVIKLLDDFEFVPVNVFLATHRVDNTRRTPQK